MQYKVYAVPAEEFSIEYVDPKVLCISTHGLFTEDRWVFNGHICFPGVTSCISWGGEGHLPEADLPTFPAFSL